MATTSESSLSGKALLDAEHEREAQRIKTLWAQHRLSFPFGLRLPMFAGFAGVVGFGLGVVHGARETGLRFRAENAHRLPSTQAGWYLYHKSKNYVSMLGGIKAGFRMGARLALWTTVFVGMEEGIDRARLVAWRTFSGIERAEAQDLETAYKYGMYQGKEGGSKDFLSTTLAGLGVAGLFSVVNRFPMATFQRMANIGIKAGFGFGVVQDLTGLVRGRRLGYVDLIKRRVLGRADEESAEIGADAA